ncbi:unnamed protein product [Amoebophrya sp. A25]|nr:unnamed protein product [Amoebophrya sp. A25]|eukprot:GSA25T00021906001.1
MTSDTTASAALYAKHDKIQDTAKHALPPTIAAVPQSYQYLLGYNEQQMTVESKALKKDIESLPQANMMGSPDEASFLGWLAELIGAKRVLEVGVFRGSTTLTLAQAVGAGGKVVGLDLSEEFAATGKKHWEASGMSDRIDFRVGKAVELLDQMIKDESDKTFDLCFIDADKASYPIYFERALTLTRPGGVIAIDNTLYFGKFLVEEETMSADAKGIKTLNEQLAQDSRVQIVMLGIADGLTLCRKK